MFKKIILILPFLIDAVDNNNAQIPQAPSMTVFYKKEITCLDSHINDLQKEHDWKEFKKNYKDSTMKKNIQERQLRMQLHAILCKLSSFQLGLYPDDQQLQEKHSAKKQEMIACKGECEEYVLKCEYEMRQKFMEHIKGK